MWVLLSPDPKVDKGAASGCHLVCANLVRWQDFFDYSCTKWDKQVVTILGHADISNVPCDSRSCIPRAANLTLVRAW